MKNNNPMLKSVSNVTQARFSRKEITLPLTVILIVSILAGGIGLFYFYNSKNQEENQLKSTKTINQSVTATTSPTDVLEKWKMYDGQIFTFNYPPNWSVTTPTETETFATDNLSYFIVDVERFGMGVNPNYDSYKEYSITVAGIKTNAKEWTWKSGTNDFLIIFEVTHNEKRIGFRLGGSRGVDREISRNLLLKILETVKLK